jgi:hypothetical protein
MRLAVVYQAAIGGFIAAAAVCLATTASAKPTRKESANASAAFKECRDKEKNGPAADCWRAWLTKYRDKGSEAEVIVAEEHSGRAEDTAKPNESSDGADKVKKEKDKGVAAEASVSVSASTKTVAAPTQAPPAGFKLGISNVGSSVTYSMAPGRAEGFRVGSSLIVKDENGRRAALLKVQRLGPGGAEGTQQPSGLALRLGSAQQGTDLVAYRMLGLSAMLYPTVGVLIPALSTGSTWVERKELRPGSYLQFKLPQAYLGGGASIGYDVSPLLRWPESNVRLRGEYLAGLYGVGTRVRAWTFELSFEKGFYLAKALELYAGLGPTATLATVDVLPPDIQIPGKPNSVQTLRAFRIGGAAYVGAEALVHPHIAIRLEGLIRVNVPTEGYNSADGGPVFWDFHARKDSFSMGGGRLGVIGMF